MSRLILDLVNIYSTQNTPIEDVLLIELIKWEPCIARKDNTSWYADWYTHYDLAIMYGLVLTNSVIVSLCPLSWLPPTTGNHWFLLEQINTGSAINKRDTER